MPYACQPDYPHNSTNLPPVTIHATEQEADDHGRNLMRTAKTSRYVIYAVPEELA